MPKKPIVTNTKEKVFSAQSLWDYNIKQNEDTLTILRTQGADHRIPCRNQCSNA
jgi:hypothetical protein